MALWVDKHRPTNLDSLDFHSSQSSQLSSISNSNDFPHLLVFGPSGAGKKTRINATLFNLFGASVSKLKIESRTFSTPSNKKIDLNIVSSFFFHSSDVGYHDKLIVQDLIKQISSTQQLDSSKRPFKVVVINEAESLSKDAQHALRRTMESKMSNLRIILCATSCSRIISPIRSRCLLIRVGAPTNSEIIQILSNIASKERSSISSEAIEKIAIASNGNLRRAVLVLEMVCCGSFKIEDGCLMDWEIYIKETCKQILSDQSPKKLLDVRSRIYELLTHCIPPELILKKLVYEICSVVDGDICRDVLCMGAEYESQMRSGQKPILHIEAFVARFMAVYKKFLFECMNVD